MRFGLGLPLCAALAFTSAACNDDEDGLASSADGGAHADAAIDASLGLDAGLKPFATLNGEQPLVIGHRGLPGLFPEETSVAYEGAADAGADSLEEDLHLSKDCVLVARHNPWLSDNTNVAEVAKTNADVAARKRTVPGRLVDVKYDLQKFGGPAQYLTDLTDANDPKSVLKSLIVDGEDHTGDWSITDSVYDRVTLSLEGVAWSDFELAREQAATCAPFTRFDTKLEQLPNERALADLHILQLRKDADRARDELSKPFRHGDRLREERARLARLDADVHEHAASQAAARTAVEGAEHASQAERGAAETQLAQGQEKLQQWNQLLQTEVQSVQTRAVALELRLLARGRQLDELHTTLSATPSTSRGVLGLLRGRALQEAAHANWSHQLDRVQATRARVDAHLAVARGYLQPAVPGYGSPASKTAMKRVGKQHP
ncbi:MAG TPA: glycerophosphodiester phosphodiesterase family protein, partial [Polyangiales bacterium]|nr:glycerophosphodiester phosphodiesterase family protein [Polyangiales bacterium]